MQTVLYNLHRRRKMMFYILLAAALIALTVHSFFEIKPVSYFDEDTQMLMVYGLISYKIIELSLLYFIFYHRHMRKLSAETCRSELLITFEKNAKRFFMLVPHGSVIFGIISYKLTADIRFFLLFMLIAATTLLLVRPKHSSKPGPEEGLII